MGTVENIYGSVVAFLGDVSETQFGAVASAMGTTGLYMATIVAILVLINMITNTYAQPAIESIKLCIKLVFVALFFRNWDQFDSVASGIFNLIDRIGASLISAVNTSSPGDSIGGYDGVAQAIDGLITSMNEAATAMSARLGVLGGGPFVSVLVWLISALMAAGAILLMTISRIAITVLIGLAPVMILLTLFEQTKNYFERWVSAIVTFALFPVVAAGVFATVIGITGAALRRVGDPSSFTSMGDFSGVLIAGLLSLVLIVSTPLLVGTLAGNYFMKLPGTATAGAKAAGALMPGLKGAAGGVGGAAASTAGFVKSAMGGQPVAKQAMQQHQASMARTMGRFSNR